MSGGRERRGPGRGERYGCFLMKTGGGPYRVSEWGSSPNCPAQSGLLKIDRSNSAAKWDIGEELLWLERLRRLGKGA
jgi:hypothetical protein